jgi:hypothetical protein
MSLASNTFAKGMYSSPIDICREAAMFAVRHKLPAIRRWQEICQNHGLPEIPGQSRVWGYELQFINGL